MVFDCPIKIGSLVVDANPYKAPELFCGFGIVVEIINSDFVFVYWDDYGITECKYRITGGDQ